jgi:hypothetical protein
MSKTAEHFKADDLSTNTSSSKLFIAAAPQWCGHCLDQYNEAEEQITSGEVAFLDCDYHKCDKDSKTCHKACENLKALPTWRKCTGQGDQMVCEDVKTGLIKEAQVQAFIDQYAKNNVAQPSPQPSSQPLSIDDIY